MFGLARVEFQKIHPRYSLPLRRFVLQVLLTLHWCKTGCGCPQPVLLWSNWISNRNQQQFEHHSLWVRSCVGRCLQRARKGMVRHQETCWTFINKRAGGVLRQQPLKRRSFSSSTHTPTQKLSSNRYARRHVGQWMSWRAMNESDLVVEFCCAHVNRYRKLQ